MEEDEKDKKTNATDTIASEITTVSSAELIEQLASKALENNLLAANFMDAYTFCGKSLAEWNELFYIELPKDHKVITPQEMVNLHLKIATYLQRCNFLYAAASSTNSSLDAASSIKKSEIVNALVSLYEARGAKRPGAPVLNHMAEHLIDSAYSRAGSQIVKNFFRDQKDTLLELRKSLEQISIMMHLEQRLS